MMGTFIATHSRQRRERRENRRQWRCCNWLRNLISHLEYGEGEAVGLKPEVRRPADATEHRKLRPKGDRGYAFTTPVLAFITVLRRSRMRAGGRAVLG
jgi:hypothetical protein